MARSAIAIGLSVAAIALTVVGRAGVAQGFDTLSPLLLTVAAVITISALGFVALSCHLACQFVVHLEIWPTSSLAVVRTAGFCRETIRLVGWNEFRTGSFRSSLGQTNQDPWLRVQLRSGRRLTLDHAHGVAPLGWAALHRFIEKCSLPEQVLPTKQTDVSASGNAPFGGLDSMRA